MEIQKERTYLWLQESENPQGGWYEQIELEIKGEDIIYMCHEGLCDNEVEETIGLPYIKKQLHNVSNKRLRGVLFYYGGEELMNSYKTRYDMLLFLVWHVAWSIYEDEKDRERREGTAA